MDKGCVLGYNLGLMVHVAPCVSRRPVHRSMAIGGFTLGSDVAIHTVDRCSRLLCRVK